VVVHTNDHPPANIHVIGHGCEAVFNLNCPCGPVELRENYRFSKRELGRIEQELNAHLSELCNEWEKIHGAD
jgi:hypothetical protein